MTFWDKYHELCTQNGKSANAVATELGFSNATCTKWKKGSEPGSKSISKIADYFGVTVDYLLGNEHKDEQPLDETESQILLLARKTKELPEADRQKLVKLFESSIETFLEAQKKND